MAPAQFAAQIAPDVIANCINTGVFPSVVIAQAIEESGSGTSKQAVNFNNLFGHMANALWTGEKAQTVAGGHFWRVYHSISDCIAAHIKILKRPLYRVAGAFTAKTPFDQALTLQKAGYNQGPDRAQYAGKLNRIITGLGLTRYDSQMQAMERDRNPNHLAFVEQSPATLTLHTLFG